MLYLDYSATTPVDKKVLDYYKKISLEYIGNPNSLHKLGKKANAFIEKCSKGILELLNVDDMEVIYTSCASESNNLVIKGVANKFKNKGKHIITTSFEHPSITAALGYLQKQGFVIDIVKSDKNGLVDLKDLTRLITNETILVSIGSVNSEIGILQPLDKIKEIVKKYPNCSFHSDMTQSIGKVHLNLEGIDFISFSGHKFYGPKGIGVLLKRKDIRIDPLIHGGKSTTSYRSGTPALPLIGAIYMALKLALKDKEEKYLHVKNINEYICKKLKNDKNIKINSNKYCIPHILNLSVLSKKGIETVKALEKEEIYISNHTACSSEEDESMGIYSLTKSHELAKSSVRISLSYLTSYKDADKLVEALRKLGV